MVKIQKQQAMRTVLKGLAPLGLAAVYFFGWRFIAVLAVVTATGVVSEYLMSRRYGLKITESLFVSCMLFALSLPPAMPLWMAAVGIAFGIVFGKMVFGGFGKNVFNPAITGRAFIYVSFGVPMTAQFINPALFVNGWFPGVRILDHACRCCLQCDPSGHAECQACRYPPGSSPGKFR